MTLICPKLSFQELFMSENSEKLDQIARKCAKEIGDPPKFEYYVYAIYTIDLYSPCKGDNYIEGIGFTDERFKELTRTEVRQEAELLQEEVEENFLINQITHRNMSALWFRYLPEYDDYEIGFKIVLVPTSDKIYTLDRGTRKFEVECREQIVDEEELTRLENIIEQAKEIKDERILLDKPHKLRIAGKHMNMIKDSWAKIFNYSTAGCYGRFKKVSVPS